MSRKDPRIQRTKKDLKQAYIKLLNMYFLHEITVKEIVYEANYNRSTFYAHYSDKDQLIQEIIDDAINGVLHSIRNTYTQKKIYDLDKLNSSIFIMYEYIYDNQNMFKILFDTKKFPTFQESFIKHLQKILIEDSKILNNRDKELDYNFWAYVQASSVVARISYWIQYDFSYPIEYIAEQTLKQIQFKSTKFLFEKKINR